MTIEERKNPDLLSSSPSRRRRIAEGSGFTEADVGELVSKFQQMRNMMQQLGQGNFPGMPGMGMPGMGMPGMGNPAAGGAQPGWRGYPGAAAPGKKKKKEKKKKGFGTL
jgi:signal recognition particle subunit SRP54